MKRFVICLLFLFTVVWSWNTTVNYFGPENLVAEKMTGSDDKVVQKLDEVISLDGSESFYEPFGTAYP